MRYDVEPMLVGDIGGESFDQMVEDFAAIAAMGFTDVLPRHVDAAVESDVLRAATAAGLTPLWPDRDVEHFVRTGRLPPDCDNERDLV
ncbi:MAG: hypothetical protein ACE5E6_04985, partial [Phycisphaerae bacterium]